MATHQRFDKRGRRGTTRQTGRPEKPGSAARQDTPSKASEPSRHERTRPGGKQDHLGATQQAGHKGHKARPFAAPRAEARADGVEPRQESTRFGDKRDRHGAAKQAGHKGNPYKAPRDNAPRAEARPERAEPRQERAKPDGKRDRRGAMRPTEHTAKPVYVPRPARPFATEPPPERAWPAEEAAAGRAPIPEIAALRYGGDWLYGRHAVAAALANPARRVRHIIALAESAAAATTLVTAARARMPDAPQPQILLRDAFEALLPDGAVHQGIAIAAEPLPALALEDIIAQAGPEPVPGEAPQVVVLLDQVSDPHNVGAVLRSAAAFGALALILPEHGAPYVTGVLAKAASGAIEHVPIVRVVNLARSMDRLKAAGFWCVGLDGAAERSLPALSLGGRLALVLGAEGDGMRRLTRERCDLIARLPTPGAMASLNVSNAAAIALYELHRGASLTPQAG